MKAMKEKRKKKYTSENNFFSLPCQDSPGCLKRVYLFTANSRRVVGKNVHSTIPKGNMGYDQYTVPDTEAVEPTFVAFL